MFKSLKNLKAKTLRRFQSDKEIVKIIEESELFDEAYYREAYGDCRPHKSALEHYIKAGASQSYDPSPFFNSAYYLQRNPDVKASGINPLLHYIINGEGEARCPNPFFDPVIYAEKNNRLIGWDKPLLTHFIQLGRYEGRQYSRYTAPAAKASACSYDEWIVTNEALGFHQVQAMLDSLLHKPLISIVVPVYNPDEELLISCIESVIAQSYQNWELCLADDQSSQPYVQAVLTRYQAQDPRIKVVFREANGNISAASNSALELATGAWVALLDHDDKLHEHAMLHVAQAINDNPNVEFIYSDEDKIDLNGSRIAPHFKSDWNLDLLYSQNYVSHLGVYQTQVVNKIGGFRLGYEGSQDYDLLLRYSREINQHNIVHIPKVLYHWRIVQGSTAMAANQKSYTTEAGIKALKDHFFALQQNVTVEQGMHENIYKVNWPIPNNPLVSLIIPTYNGYQITKQAIDSILEKTTYVNFEILVVDNNSDDPTALAYFEQLAQHEKISVLRYPHPFNYSAINNFAAKHARGDVIGLINNDVEVISPEWLSEMVSHAIRPEIGCVGAMLYYDNDTIQHAGVITGIGGVGGHSHKYFNRGEHGYFSRLKVVQNYSAVTAACLLVRKTVFEQVGGLNEHDLTIAFNDVDFCLKVKKAGYRNLWTPYAELYHHESISRGAENDPQKIARFKAETEYMKTTWLTHEICDPCYNPNLSRDREDFSIRKVVS